MLKKIGILLVALSLLTCSKESEEEPELSSSKAIIKFDIKFNNSIFIGEINNNNIIVKTEGLELVNNFELDVTISPMSTIVPDPSGVNIPFSNKQFTVTAENGETSSYTVLIQNTKLSSEKDILSFDFNIKGKLIKGKLLTSENTVQMVTYEDITNVIPEVTISDKATISPTESTPQNFTNFIDYTVTAQNGSTKDYIVKTYKPQIDIYEGHKFYTRAFCTVNIGFFDISNYKDEVYLENSSNSYLLDIYEINDVDDVNGGSFFKFYFSENIVTAQDYKLVIKKEGELVIESDFFIDVIAENPPEIYNTDKNLYYYTDSIKIGGKNLHSNIGIRAFGALYHFHGHYLKVNSDKTELSFQLNNYGMFPSNVNQNSPQSLRISAYKNGRFGESIYKDFN